VAVDKKTVLVVSRHPELADVRKHVLEQAGFEAVSISEPERIEEACRNHKISLVAFNISAYECVLNKGISKRRAILSEAGV
jgi:DNA-binding response OmpR family regulator